MDEVSSTSANDTDVDKALQDMQMLLDAGYQTNANRMVDRDGKYCCVPLSAAALIGCIRAVEMLLQAGALPNAAERKTHEMPLHIAAWNDRVDIIRALIAAGADVHASTSAGWIPLHCAASGLNSNAVEELLRSGANPNAVHCGTTLLHSLARFSGQRHADCLDIEE